MLSSAESHLGLLDRVVRSAKRLSERELCCLRHRRKDNALCLLCKICHRVDYPMNKHSNHFVAVRNIGDSAILGELALVIPRCRNDQFSRSFFSACCCSSVELAAVGRV